MALCFPHPGSEASIQSRPISWFHPAGLCSVLHDGHGQGPKMQDVLQLVGRVNSDRDLDFHFCGGP